MEKKVNVQTDKKLLNLEYSLNWGIDIENRIIRITSEIDEGLFDFVDAALTTLESISKKAVTIRINSPGGNEPEALAIIGRMENKKVSKIVTEGYGIIMSAACLIFAAGNERRISNKAWVMHHQGFYAVEGTHSTIKHEVQFQERAEKQWAKAMEQYTKLSEDFWMTAGVNENLYLSPQECIDHGLADKII